MGQSKARTNRRCQKKSPRFCRAEIAASRPAATRKKKKGGALCSGEPTKSCRETFSACVVTRANIHTLNQEMSKAIAQNCGHTIVQYATSASLCSTFARYFSSKMGNFGRSLRAWLGIWDVPHFGIPFGRTSRQHLLRIWSRVWSRALEIALEEGTNSLCATAPTLRGLPVLPQAQGLRP